MHNLEVKVGFKLLVAIKEHYVITKSQNVFATEQL